ncbi:MAG: hypothetical protein K6G87_01215 [Butyrivibrio sp.]|uniref:hypothetical protein n=1 Tax=Butyrivibrio sp. TaxID=28121 RepID=UPI0025EA0DF0|nr:hypothetical protein [Butyrivibrio sp.]MCR5769833.1 hypothetical protein [Butyrivibrio sp.]
MTTIENPNARKSLKKKAKNGLSRLLDFLSIIMNSKVANTAGYVLYAIGAGCSTIVALYLIISGSQPKEEYKYSNIFVLSLILISIALLFIVVFIEKINKKDNKWMPGETSFGSFIFWCLFAPDIIEAIYYFVKDFSSGIYIGFMFVFTVIWHSVQWKMLYDEYKNSKVSFLNICDQLALVLLTFYWVVFQIADFAFSFAAFICLFMLMQMGTNIVVYLYQLNQETQ